MKTKLEIVNMIKNIIDENKKISLSLDEIGIASWKKNYTLMTPIEWKHIGYVSALSESFGITPLDIK